ncbi:MAG: hypothetical protein ACXV95_15895, partial [Acidimicrobiales bacterium]
ELLGRAAGLPRLLSFGHRLSTPLTRRLVGGVAGLGLVASLTAFTVGSPVAAWADTITVRTAPSALAPAPTSAPGTSVDGAAGAPVMRALDPDDLAVDPPVMRALDDQPGATKTTATTATTAATDAPTTTLPTTASSSPPASIRPGPEPRPPPATERGTADQWVIERGDHLWGVARRTLAGAWSRPPTDVEVARYLDRLIEANGAVLVVPGDADLVLPGQVFTLPPVPAG